VFDAHLLSYYRGFIGLLRERKGRTFALSDEGSMGIVKYLLALLKRGKKR